MSNPSYNFAGAGSGSGTLVKTTSDVQELTIPGLDGNADGGYYIEGVIHVPTLSGGTVFSWRPNGLATNQVARLNSLVAAYASASTMAFTESINLSTAPLCLHVSAWFNAQTTVGGVATWRNIYTRTSFNFNIATTYQTIYHSNANWQETSTNVTSLSVYASTGAHILAGSQLRYWKTAYKWDA